MRRRLPGVDAELSAAVDRVRGVYRHLAEPRPDIAGEHFHRLEAELDVLCGAGDRKGAMKAIKRWEKRTISMLRRHQLHAPLVIEEEAA